MTGASGIKAKLPHKPLLQLEILLVHAFVLLIAFETGKRVYAVFGLWNDCNQCTTQSTTTCHDVVVDWVVEW